MFMSSIFEIVDIFAVFVALLNFLSIVFLFQKIYLYY